MRSSGLFAAGIISGIILLFCAIACGFIMRPERGAGCGYHAKPDAGDACADPRYNPGAGTQHGL